MSDIDEFFKPCDHPQRFTIEPHGDGMTLYFGRCGHFHGYNLGAITDISFNALEILNKPLEEKAGLDKRIAELEEALKTVYDDCKIRAVDGVVPLGNGCWTKICKALEPPQEKDHE